MNSDESFIDSRFCGIINESLEIAGELQPAPECGDELIDRRARRRQAAISNRDAWSRRPRPRARLYGAVISAYDDGSPASMVPQQDRPCDFRSFRRGVNPWADSYRRRHVRAMRHHRPGDDRGGAGDHPRFGAAPLKSVAPRRFAVTSDGFGAGSCRRRGRQPGFCLPWRSETAP